ncbi:zinc-dependent alcohol dehydrogenase [Microbacterium atlanticum]|uniref:zinc-dependent alcohol dehydrogenase n=1 Tax=Microbacterium atlanticum TaxID=2782168 RepID=UPI001E657505|nr:zinc-binding alcohol dehydrogenase [Microbacterium atlanticum]
MRLPPPSEGEASVRTLWTGLSRGTESLVARGAVPASEHDRMRAPFQEGDFPFPVKYGYLSVGRVEDGPPDLAGRTVFALYPHQSRFVVPAAALTVVPDGVPARRAVLAGAIETAVNVLWDARPLVGDRVVIVGAGMIGGAIARLARGIPGADVTLVDVDESKRAVADALGVGFTAAEPAGDGADVVIEASGSAEGLQVALRAAPTDGEVVVASWFGDRPVPLELGADFHSRRLAIRASQVGAVASSRRSRRTTQDRLALAVRLLQDPAFDALLGASSSWRQLPDVTSALADGTAGPLCHTIDWSAA